MKKTLRLSFLLMLILTMTLVIVSCGVSDSAKGLHRKIENRVDSLEDRIENEHRTVSKKLLSENDVALTKENAENIAIEHADISTSDVLYLHTEFDIDDGVPVYEVSFCVDVENRVEHTEYEYVIHADDGTIIELDIDHD